MKIIKNHLKFCGLVVIATMLFTGCSLFQREVNPHFIEGEDIFSIETGSKIIFPDGTEKVTDRMGWFTSDHWQKEVSKTIKEERQP